MATQQLSIFKKPVIYHYSLTCIWEECPTCGTINRATLSKWDSYEQKYYTQYFSECPECGQAFDWSDEALESVAKYTKEYRQAMKDVPNGGAVEKLANGHYIEIT